MTASKPETHSGAIAFPGSQEIWCSPVASPRTRRVTSYPRVLRGGRSAAPMGPETPVTRIREIMADSFSLYQLAAPSTKPVANSKDSKRPKCEPEDLGSMLERDPTGKSDRASYNRRRVLFYLCPESPLPRGYNPSWRACANRSLLLPSR